jgi:hypothetical protein
MAFDPAAWTEGAVALKSAFDAFRSAIGLAKEIRGGGTSAQQETVIKALEQGVARLFEHKCRGEEVLRRD